jgi:predicted ribosomally synthesized peptide with nif11-like leader
MSKDNLKRFMTQVAESEELKARIGEEIDGDALIALGAEHGCEFSAEDLVPGAELSDQELSDQELSDQELDGVVGAGDRGGYIYSDGPGVGDGPRGQIPPFRVRWSRRYIF